jgi:hypothetical protein
MAYLTVGGVTVKVIHSAPRRREEAVGEVRRAFSGAPRSSVRAYYSVWEGVETTWITRTAADTLRAALKGTPPVACTGDLTGSINAYVSNIQEVEKARLLSSGSNVEHVRLSFDLWAA